MQLALVLSPALADAASMLQRHSLQRKDAEVATLCGQYSSWSGDGYNANNNNWGEDSATSGSQCTYVDSSSSSGVAWHTTWTWEGGSGDVKSYAYAGRVVDRGHTISSISSMQTQVSWSYNDTDITATNVAYDFFTSEDPDHSTSSGDYELMIWLARYGGATPLGSMNDTVTIAGQTWDFYVGGHNGEMAVYTFAASSTITSFSGDAKDFFDYVTEHQGFPASTQHLLVFQVGSEATTGGPTTFTVSHFSASVST